MKINKIRIIKPVISEGLIKSGRKIQMSNAMTRKAKEDENIELNFKTFVNNKRKERTMIGKDTASHPLLFWPCLRITVILKRTL